MTHLVHQSSVLFRVRPTYAQIRDEPRSSYIVLRRGFLKLPSLYAFPLGKSFLLLGTPFLVFWLESHSFSFPDVLCTAHNCVCCWDLVVRDQGEKSNRGSSHTLESVVSLLRENCFLSLSFRHLFCYCCLCVTVGLNRGGDKRVNEKHREFPSIFLTHKKPFLFSSWIRKRRLLEHFPSAPVYTCGF